MTNDNFNQQLRDLQDKIVAIFIMHLLDKTSKQEIENAIDNIQKILLTMEAIPDNLAFWSILHGGNAFSNNIQTSINRIYSDLIINFSISNVAIPKSLVANQIREFYFTQMQIHGINYNNFDHILSATQNNKDTELADEEGYFDFIAHYDKSQIYQNIENDVNNTDALLTSLEYSNNENNKNANKSNLKDEPYRDNAIESSVHPIIDSQNATNFLRLSLNDIKGTEQIKKEFEEFLKAFQADGEQNKQFENRDQVKAVILNRPDFVDLIINHSDQLQNFCINYTDLPKMFLEITTSHNNIKKRSYAQIENQDEMDDDIYHHNNKRYKNDEDQINSYADKSKNPMLEECIDEQISEVDPFIVAEENNEQVEGAGSSLFDANGNIIDS